MDRFSAKGFGISSGISTMMGLLVGFYATSASKMVILSALLSLIISDPISDSYGIYIALVGSNPELANKYFLEIFIYKLLIQLWFFLIMLLTPLKLGFMLSFITGTMLIIVDYITRFKDTVSVISELVKMGGLIFIIFVANNILQFYNVLIDN